MFFVVKIPSIPMVQTLDHEARILRGTRALRRFDNLGPDLPCLFRKVCFESISGMGPEPPGEGGGISGKGLGDSAGASNPTTLHVTTHLHGSEMRPGPGIPALFHCPLPLGYP